MPAVNGGTKMGGNDTVPLSLACRAVAKAASRLALDPDSNEAEVQVGDHVQASTPFLLFSCRYPVLLAVGAAPHYSLRSKASSRGDIYNLVQ